MSSLVLVSAGPDAPPAQRGVRVLDTAVLPTSLADGNLGGTSGLDYDRRSGEWLLISDDKSEHAPARIYRARIMFDRHMGLRVRSVSAITLTDANGRPFPAQGSGREAVDGEAIRLWPGGRGFVWASEGDPRDGFGPALRISARAGRTTSAIPLPDPIPADWRPNKTIEGLSFGPAGTLWASMEAPLIHDGPEAGLGRAAWVRFLRFRAGKPTRQYGYPVDPVVRQRAGRLADNGVSEILAIDNYRLLVLERSGEQRSDSGFVFHCRLYLADFRNAQALTLASSRPPARLASKRLLVDFDRLTPGDFGNLEGMAWWPGRKGRWLMLASDNNFAPGEPTRLTLVEFPQPLSAEAAPPLAAPSASRTSPVR